MASWLCGIIFFVICAVRHAAARNVPRHALASEEVSALFSFPMSALVCEENCAAEDTSPVPSASPAAGGEPDFMPLDEWKEKVLDDLKRVIHTSSSAKEQSATHREKRNYTFRAGSTSLVRPPLEILWAGFACGLLPRTLREDKHSTAFGKKQSFRLDHPTTKEVTHGVNIDSAFSKQAELRLSSNESRIRAKNQFPLVLIGKRRRYAARKKQSGPSQPVNTGSLLPSKHSDVNNQIEEEIRKQLQDGRFNFASFDAGARILASNEGSAGAKNILTNDRDKYMLSPCWKKPSRVSEQWNTWLWQRERELTQRWVVVELSEDILMKSFEVANFEYYSSSPSRIILFGAKAMPQGSENWRELGSWMFDRVTGKQLHELQSSKIVRYLKFSFQGALDSEYYCTISEVRVFGERLLDDWSALFKPKQTAGVDDSLPDKLIEPSEALKPKVEDVTSSGGPSISNSAADVEVKQGGASPPSSGISSGESGAESEVVAYEDFKRLVGDVAEAALGGDDEESIFRRVTRMIRTLELNQSLTNHYINTHLRRYATSLQETRHELEEAKKESAIAKGHLEKMSTQLAATLELATSAAPMGGVTASWKTELARSVLLPFLSAMAACGVCIILLTPRRVAWLEGISLGAAGVAGVAGAAGAAGAAGRCQEGTGASNAQAEVKAPSRRSSGRAARRARARNKARGLGSGVIVGEVVSGSEVTVGTVTTETLEMPRPPRNLRPPPASDVFGIVLDGMDWQPGGDEEERAKWARWAMD